MSKPAELVVPAGLVRNITSQWGTNGSGTTQGARKGVPRLHNKILQDILCKDGTREVTSFTVTKPREQEEAGTSDIMTVEVLLSDQTHVDLFCKFPNSSSTNVKVLNLKELFKKEALMYSTVIPKLKQEDPLQMFATCYHSSPDLIVLDNLSPRGFLRADLEAGLDSAHCRLVFTELGRFHAAAYVINAYESEAGEEVLYTDERSPVYEEKFAELKKETVRIIQQTNETTRYARKVEKILDSTYENLLKCLNYKGKFMTLNHGELCSENLLFLYDEGEPVEVKFLDFQTCRYGSPALDIIHFLSTSTRAEVRDQHMDDLMRTYHRSLSRALRQAGVAGGLSLMELRREIDSLAMYALLTAHMHRRDTFASHRIAEVVLDIAELGAL